MDFLLRLLSVLPNSGEDLLDLVSRALPSAASAMTLATASSPLPRATRNGSWLDRVPTGGLCDVNDLPRKLKTCTKLKGTWNFLPEVRKNSFQLFSRVFLLCLLWTEQPYLSCFKVPKRDQNKLQQIFAFQQGHIVVFQEKEKIVLFTAQAATGAT